MSAVVARSKWEAVCRTASWGARGAVVRGRLPLLEDLLEDGMVGRQGQPAEVGDGSAGGQARAEAGLGLVQFEERGAGRGRQLTGQCQESAEGLSRILVVEGCRRGPVQSTSSLRLVRSGGLR